MVKLGMRHVATADGEVHYTLPRGARTLAW
jgi:hypothetical protein